MKVYKNTEIIYIQTIPHCQFYGEKATVNDYFDEYTKCEDIYCECEKAQEYAKLNEQLHEINKKIECFYFENKMSGKEKDFARYKILKERFENES